MLKRILVGLGGTPFSAIATRCAIELAKAHGAEVTAVTVLNEEKLRHVGDAFFSRHDGAPDGEERLERARELLLGAVTAFREACKEARVPCDVEWEDEAPFQKLVDSSYYHDLTIVGLRALFDYELVDDPKDILVRMASGGVRPILAVSEKYRPIQRVLVLFDGSLEAANTLKRFVPMHLWPDLKLRLLCFQKPEKEAERILGNAAAYCKAHGYRVERDSIIGLVPTQLTRHAREWDADLIVLGNSSRKAWTESLLGNTVEHVIMNADRPIFLSQ